MQAAGAYRLAQTVFLGKRTLIVESISDYRLLKALSHYLHENGGGGLHKDTLVLWAGGTSHMLPLASIMAAREQMGPNRMAVLLFADRAGLDKARKLVEIMAHGQDSVMLVREAIGIPNAEGEDVAEFDELLIGLKETGRIPASQSYPRLNAASSEPRADCSAVRCVPVPYVFSGNSVRQWQDGHGNLPDRIPPERPSTFPAHLSHTGRATTSQSPKSSGQGCLMPDQ